jgi:hypothetical protein
LFTFCLTILILLGDEVKEQIVQKDQSQDETFMFFATAIMKNLSAKVGNFRAFKYQSLEFILEFETSLVNVPQISELEDILAGEYIFSQISPPIIINDHLEVSLNSNLSLDELEKKIGRKISLNFSDTLT